MDQPAAGTAVPAAASLPARESDQVVLQADRQAGGAWPSLGCAAAVVAPPGTLDCAARAAPLDQCDAQGLLRWLALHRVEPMAARNLRTFAVAPTCLRSALDDAWRRNTVRTLNAIDTLRRVRVEFAAAGIPWLVLKGVTVSARYYDDLTLRHVGDLDLLVEPAAMPVADRCLRILGYAPVVPRGAGPAPGWLRRLRSPGHEVSYAHPTAVPVELHHRLHPNAHLIPVPVAQLLAQGDCVMVGNVPVPALAAPIESLYLATHGTRHGWYRMQWVLDMAMIARRDPDGCQDVARRARRLGVERPLLDGLLLAGRLFGTPVPARAHALVLGSRRLRYLHRYSLDSLQARRDAAGLPVGREHSPFLAALCQADGLRFAVHEALWRIRHEIGRLGTHRTQSTA